MFRKGTGKARIGIAPAIGLLLTMGIASAGGAGPQPAGPQPFTPGAAGAGDAYFPLDGNGGYDTTHYLLDLKYDPATDVLEGVATIEAKATQNLSRFNLDLEGLTVQSIKIDGHPATWTRSGGELVITPRPGIRDKQNFRTEIKYRGIPETLEDGSGFIHTDDGALIIGEPHVAATWYPVNDHPSDKAAYTVRMTVPAGLEAVGNGVLVDSKTKQGWTTWTWDAKEPMASYLVTASLGEFDLSAYKKHGIRFWDAVDPDLYDPTGSPRTGDQFAISQVGQPAFKRLMKTIPVPAGGATLSFWIDRDTEQNWDFTFVEAHAVGSPNWTTLRDLNGHTSQDTGFVCPYWLGLHPFLEHYQTDNGDDSCSPTGDTGNWWAVSGSSDGYEQWRVDLSAYAGSSVEVSISYASDDLVQLPGAFVDDIVVSTGVGSTSFENDGNTMDGWTVPGAPSGSEPNPNDWIVGTSADIPPPIGTVIDASFARESEIIDFESSIFGPYPFSASGGIVDDVAGLGFALENQTRPIYSTAFFTDTFSGDSVIVHELAHQWYGDSLAVAKWQHIWLNEGFATYAEWLWSEHEDLGSAQDLFDFYYNVIPADDPFWQVVIGDPGPDLLFDISIYYRGAMTLHQLRLAVGDRDFFKILRTWATTHAGGNVTIPEFIQLAEHISHKNLDDLFETWLFTPGKPELSPALSARSGSVTSQSLNGRAGALFLKNRLGARH
jgi:peptidase M1-like protein/immune inhibitor InhA-like protein